MVNNSRRTVFLPKNRYKEWLKVLEGEYENVVAPVNKGKVIQFSLLKDGRDRFGYEPVPLDGFIVTKITPESRENFEAVDGHYFYYYFEEEIQPNSEINVVFTLKAVQSGIYSGDLDFCVDKDTGCLYNSVKINVVE